MTNILKIYADEAWMMDGRSHVIMLYPFWGHVELPATDPDRGRFDDYISKAHTFMEMSNAVESCDIAVFPMEYDFSEGMKLHAQAIARQVKQHGKKLLIFNNSDFDDPITVENSIVLRTSFYKSTKASSEFAFPGWSNDFLKLYRNGHLKTADKPAKPAISYCGYVGGQKKGLAGLFKKLMPASTPELMKSGALLRGTACAALQKDNNIDCHFIIRDGFWAQGITDKLQARKEYAENMLSSHYALVARGAGNFSYRLYEVLSCGKIPVFINTNCVLPYEAFIAWKKHMVWIEVRDIKHLSRTLQAFHHSISEEQFTAIQHANRGLYEEWLSPTGFFSKLHHIVK